MSRCRKIYNLSSIQTDRLIPSKKLLKWKLTRGNLFPRNKLIKNSQTYQLLIQISEMLLIKDCQNKIHPNNCKVLYKEPLKCNMQILIKWDHIMMISLVILQRRMNKFLIINIIPLQSMVLVHLNTIRIMNKPQANVFLVEEDYMVKIKCPLLNISTNIISPKFKSSRWFQIKAIKETCKMKCKYWPTQKGETLLLRSKCWSIRVEGVFHT